MKKITFIPSSEIVESAFERPKPAKAYVPSWYKSLPRAAEPKLKSLMFPDLKPNLTVKACFPFLDALTGGYIIPLSADVEAVDPVTHTRRLVWSAEWDVVSQHDTRQLSSESVYPGYEDGPVKWNNGWVIKVPKGYSLLFCHPLNRPDLPFRTMAGIVDADSYDIPVNFPFFLKNDFYGVIERGTPIVQIIPIKREKWHSEFVKYSNDLDYLKHALAKHNSKIQNAYKLFNWSKKEYK